MHIVLIEAFLSSKVIADVLNRLIAEKLLKWEQGDFKVITIPGSSMQTIRTVNVKIGDDKEITGFEPEYDVSYANKRFIEMIGGLLRYKTKRNKVHESIDPTDINTLWICTQPTRGGELLAYQLSNALQFYGRRVFITSCSDEGILNAFLNVRPVNACIVQAQRARETLEFLERQDIGKALSMIFRNTSVALAGLPRIQCAIIADIYDRWDIARSKDPEEFWEIEAEFKVAEPDMRLILYNYTKESPTRQFAQEVFSTAQYEPKYALIVNTKESELLPSEPFTTSSLLIEAYTKHSIDPYNAITAALALFQAGHITYPMTEHCTLHPRTKENVVSFLLQYYGAKSVCQREWITKKMVRTELENIYAIVPTRIEATSEVLCPILPDQTQRKIYDMIWKRTMATQMQAATVVKYILTARGAGTRFIGTHQILKYAGWKKIYNPKIKEETAPVFCPYVEPLSMSMRQIHRKRIIPHDTVTFIEWLNEKGLSRCDNVWSILNTLEDMGIITYDSKSLAESQVQKELIWHANTAKDNLNNVKISSIESQYPHIVPTSKGSELARFIKTLPLATIDIPSLQFMEQCIDMIAGGSASFAGIVRSTYAPMRATMSAALNTSSPSTNVIKRAIPSNVKLTHNRYGPCIYNISKLKYINVAPYLEWKGKRLEDLTTAEINTFTSLPIQISPDTTVNFDKQGFYLFRKRQVIRLRKSHWNMVMNGSISDTVDMI